MAKMERRYGELPEVQYQRSARMKDYLGQSIAEPAEDTAASPMAEMFSKMQESTRADIVNEPSQTAFHSDQFAGLAQILGG